MAPISPPAAPASSGALSHNGHETEWVDWRGPSLAARHIDCLIRRDLLCIHSLEGGCAVSKFDLRDISERLARSKDSEAVVFEFLGFLQNMRADWRAALAFYEVSSDTLVNLYERQGARLLRRDLRLPVDQLPARLVRKFFHPSAFFSPADRRSILAQLLHASPAYEPDPVEAPLL